MSSRTFQTVKGMKDLLPTETPRWFALESHLRTLLNRYGYTEIRPPIVESTALFSRSIGEGTDIVDKEMYSFVDQGEEALTLRPEATCSLVRAVIEHGLIHNQVQRLWCYGPMFRRENPQKGRYRQFHQLDVEVFGLPGPDIDAELIALTARLWRELGLHDLTLQLNSLGTTETRTRYREQLVSYFSAHREALDADSQRRLDRNPLRILDSKNPAMQPLLKAAPMLLELLDDESKAHFEGLKAKINALAIPFEVNPLLVRGLDYYSRTVFEWVPKAGGGTVAAGGRYDRLVEQLGGKPTPAIGFAIGLERLLMALPDDWGQPEPLHAYLLTVGEAAEAFALPFAEQLRDLFPALRLRVHCGGGSFKSQFKKADQSGAQWALILGDDEMAHERVGVKPLRTSAPQDVLPRQALPDFIRQFFHL